MRRTRDVQYSIRWASEAFHCIADTVRYADAHS
jgi:hypothetical protein